MSSIPELLFSKGFEPELLSHLQKVGVVKICGTITEVELKRLNAEFEEILDADRSGVRDLGVKVGGGKNVIRKELSTGSFEGTVRYFTQPWMQNLSDLYWGDSRVLNDNIFVTREVIGTEHLAQSLHFDVQETLKFFLYLNDVTRENGAFSCVPRSVSLTKEKRKKLGDNVSYENRGPSREHPFSEDQIIPVEAKAGTLIVFTTEVWHRAGLVKSGERRVMRGHTRTKDVAHQSANAITASSRTKQSLVRRIKSVLRRS